MNRRPSIVVADDHPVVGAAIASSLEKWFRVAATVDTIEALEVALRRESPAAVLLDLSFGDESSLSMLPDFVKAHPATRFVVLTAHAEPVLVDAALRAGAAGYIVKQSAPTEVRVALEEALEGRTYVTPLLRPHSSTSAIVDSALQERESIRLSDRQKQILRLLRTGHTYRQIADQLHITTKTVEYHIDILRTRLGVSRTAQLVRWAESNGVADEG